MEFFVSGNRFQSFLLRNMKLMLVFGLLFAACFTGVGKVEAAAGSDLIIVNKKTNKLAYFSDGKLVKIFPVATGKSKELTPEGSFKMVVKVKNRPYYKEKIPGGDPANPLGDRWLGLEVNGTYGTTYAIHGNNNESSIGKYVSAGCIRMHNDDIHWLYPQIAKNTRVIITTSTLAMENIATKNGYAVGSNKFAGAFEINGATTKLKDSFIVENSRVFVPLRESVALLGGTLQSEAGTGALLITIGNRTVTHKPLSNKAIVNGKSVTILPSRNENNRLLIPLSILPDLFGIQVQWNGQTQVVKIKL
ncbi:L,D-transpeptidase family protein [Paenibacillus sp. FSL R10-2734]|uniref:L,D-transpeptidase family protein n=1 Tax=Paenibacillus sp. FSL R10-2734 TaxID=2954691 RepID=UPI0030DB210C